MFQFIVFVLTISCVFSATQVFSCDDGEYVDGTKCKSCPAECTKCISSSVCTACQDRYFLYTADNTCQLKTLITTDNCIDIVDKTDKVCKTCATGFWLKTDNTCVAVALTNCLTWASGATEACATFKCSTIHAKCTSCDTATVCTGCDSGYFLSADTTCTAATRSCLTWEKSTTEACASCPTGYEVNSAKFCYASQCLYPSNTSLSCGSGKARSSFPDCDVACTDANCVDCESAAESTCLECETGYGLFDKKCYADLKYCATASSATACTTCLDTAEKIDNLCVLILENCATMTSNNVCATCEDGYVKEGDVCTGTCNDGCTCTTANTCAACKTGYHTNGDSTCVTVKNCAKMGSATLCMTCKEGYLVSNDRLSCETINNCAVMYNLTHCTTCNEDYFVDADKACVTITNCAIMTDLTHCATCKDGYQANSDNTACTKCLDANCKTCAADGKTCSVCNDGYYVDKTKADADDVDAVCVECTDTNAKYIKTTCTDTQRVNFPWTCAALAGNCAANDPTPLIGESSQSCKACSPGYRLNAGVCTVCTPENCYQCDAEVAKCAECNFGYYVKDDACVACDATTCQKCSSTDCLDSRLSTILTAGKTNENAGKSLQLLLQFADAASEAQESYSAVITTACGITELSQTNFQVALAAADKVMSNATDKKGIYQLGFETCVTNLLKNVGTPIDISPMKMANSEFTMQKFTKADKDKTIELTGVKATMNEDFMTAVGDGDFYATFQAIPNSVNPYANEQRNNKFKFSSKIVSFSVRTAGASSAAKTVKLATDKTFPIEFDAGTSGICIYYKTADKKWTEDGTLTGKTCAFSHLTDFAIYKDETDSKEENAYMLQVLSIMLIFIVAMF